MRWIKPTPFLNGFTLVLGLILLLAGMDILIPTVLRYHIIIAVQYLIIGLCGIIIHTIGITIDSIGAR